MEVDFRASGQASGEIAAAWTEQPGFPIVKVARDPQGKITLTQERFTVHFENAPPLEWKIPLTYTAPGMPATASLLMTSKSIELPNSSGDRAVKLNVGGAGNYRVEYDDVSWNLLVAELPKLSPPDRVNLLSDAWALVQANRAPLSRYLSLVEKLPGKTELAEREQVMHVFDFINRLLAGQRKRAVPKICALNLAPSFDQVGWEPKTKEERQDRFAAGEPDQCARRFGRQRDRGGLPRTFAKISNRSEIAPAGFARTGHGGRGALRG